MDKILLDYYTKTQEEFKELWEETNIQLKRIADALASSNSGS